MRQVTEIGDDDEWTYTGEMNIADNGSLGAKITFKLRKFITRGGITFQSDQTTIDVTYLGRGWLAGWNKRIQVAIDCSRIEKDLSDFPILIHLSASSSVCRYRVTQIFDELRPSSKRSLLPPLIVIHNAMSGRTMGRYRRGGTAVGRGASCSVKH